VNRKLAYVLGAAAGTLALDGAGRAGETQTYTYDALGRLVATQHTAGAHAGQANSLCYDAAGNRTQYQSSSTGALASCGGGTPSPPPPPPPPPPGNQPPVAVDDTASVAQCATEIVNVVANDSDPDGNYPLTVTSDGGATWAEVVSSTSIRFTGRLNPGTRSLTYTIQDAAGATDTGTLTTITLDDDQCF
jgi:hypothetical protein